MVATSLSSYSIIFAAGVEGLSVKEPLLDALLDEFFDGGLRHGL